MAGIRLILFYRFATADPLFLLLLQKKKQRVRNDHDGTSRRKRRLLSSVLISSFPNRKRCAGLRFGARRDFDFPPDLLEPTKKTASVFLDLSRVDWQICAKNFFQAPTCLSLWERWLSEAKTERVYRDCQNPLSRLRRRLSQRESQGANANTYHPANFDGTF